MTNDVETSSSSEESSSDSEEEQKSVSKQVERIPLVEKNVVYASSSGSEESDSEESESQDSKTDASRAKPRSVITIRSERMTAGVNGVKKVESEKKGKVESNRVAPSKSVTAAEDEQIAPARRSDPKVAASRVNVVVGDKNKSGPSRTESSKATLGDKKRPTSASQATGALAKKGRNSKTAAASSKMPHKWLKAEEIALADALRADSRKGIIFPKDKSNKHWQSMMERLKISDPPLLISQFHEKIRRMKSKYLSMRKNISSYAPSWRNTHEGRLYKMWDSVWGRGSLNSVFTDAEGDDEDDDQSDSEDETRRDEVKFKSSPADYPRTVTSLDALGPWSAGTPGVAYVRRLPELKDTPPEFRKPLLHLKKRYGELHREQINVAVIRLKSALQQCEVERNLSVLQYETEEFLARLPIKCHV